MPFLKLNFRDGNYRGFNAYNIALIEGIEPDTVKIHLAGFPDKPIEFKISPDRFWDKFWNLSIVGEFDTVEIDEDDEEGKADDEGPDPPPVPRPGDPGFKGTKIEVGYREFVPKGKGSK